MYNIKLYYIFQAEIEHVQADKESLEQTIGTLESSLDVLNDKLEDAKERERLIVEYPDINGPVNPDLTGIILFWPPG